MVRPALLIHSRSSGSFDVVQHWPALSPPSCYHSPASVWTTDMNKSELLFVLIHVSIPVAQTDWRRNTLINNSLVWQQVHTHTHTPLMLRGTVGVIVCPVCFILHKRTCFFNVFLYTNTDPELDCRSHTNISVIWSHHQYNTVKCALYCNNNAFVTNSIFMVFACNFLELTKGKRPIKMIFMCTSLKRIPLYSHQGNMYKIYAVLLV